MEILTDHTLTRLTRHRTLVVKDGPDFYPGTRYEDWVRAHAVVIEIEWIDGHAPEYYVVKGKTTNTKPVQPVECRYIWGHGPFAAELKDLQHWTEGDQL